jgi:hypothetical protein
VKVADENQLLEFAESSAEEVRTLGDEMQRLYGGDTTDLLLDGVAAGSLKVATVTLDGERIVVLWYWVSAARNRLVVNAIKSLVQRDIFHHGIFALEKFARAQKCESIEWVTGRIGLVKKARRVGYKLRGFYVEKCLT